MKQGHRLNAPAAVRAGAAVMAADAAGTGDGAADAAAIAGTPATAGRPNAGYSLPAGYTLALRFIGWCSTFPCLYRNTSRVRERQPRSTRFATLTLFSSASSSLGVANSAGDLD